MSRLDNLLPWNWSPTSVNPWPTCNARTLTNLLSLLPGEGPALAPALAGIVQQVGIMGLVGRCRVPCDNRSLPVTPPATSHAKAREPRGFPGDRPKAWVRTVRMQTGWLGRQEAKAGCRKTKLFKYYNILAISVAPKSGTQLPPPTYLHNGPGTAR